MRKVVSVLLILVLSFAMCFSVTGCKKTTHYTSPKSCIDAYLDGDKIIDQKCTVTVKVNRDQNTVRREIYSSIFDKSADNEDFYVRVSIPSSETVSEGQTVTIIITDIKTSFESYEIYGYIKN
ncbi:MAG: hypothetical protein MJ093_05390 [Saccharofermentans sp.]|nr:hypothetical protein [Saccharofermentans sp.]